MEKLLSFRFVGTNELPFFNTAELLTKQAQIRRQQAKEEKRPFLTISGTRQRSGAPNPLFVDH